MVLFDAVSVSVFKSAMSVVRQCTKVFPLVLLLASSGSGLLCYNGTLTSARFGDDPLSADSLVSSGIGLARLRCAMTVRCEDNAMCFVRSWSARAKHAWLVQRGCYKSGPDDPLPRSVRSPTRAMSCKRERYKDAEYKVCLCQADWCNPAQLHTPLHVTAVVGLTNVLRCLYLP
ncbi:uncharacterized protein LOC125228575 isoform X2 [Leguminivora glycinivorella]|uniref:uncharacterized protein LOC125228575 isoform X2 n=1 Tax=Leguminivora glycinivorella TaxID=1035111 RepID=UPI002010909A|nr:uncharacterized protein LOC125228575 isoform X2 [Leguminivora glycinivorella]